MDPPSPTITTAEATTAATKLRLMVSYGGHIVPRPTDKRLFYAAGESRIVAVDRRTVAASLSSFKSHLSINLFQNRPFHLKYQLPNEDLDSLISVSNDEDLINMLEEHDRVSTIASIKPSRIRLFLFNAKPESAGSGSGSVLGSGLFDAEADAWFSDAMKNSGVVSSDSALGDGLLGRVKSGGGLLPESMVLETNSSFGSTSSSVSMSNLPPIGVQYEDGGVGLVEKKGRVLSSASIESDGSIGSSGVLPKTVVYQDSLKQLASGVPTFTIDPEITLADPSTMVPLQGTAQLSGYQLPQPADGKLHQHEVQYIQGNASYIPQYSAAPPHPTSYYPVYQIPLHQQQNGSYPVNQPYPVYYYPVRAVQSYNMPMHNNVINSQNLASSRPPLHPQTTTTLPPVYHKEIFTVQPSPDSAVEFQGTVQAATSLVSASSGQGQQLMPPPEHVQPSQPIPAAFMDITNNSNELDDNIAYNQIYKTQPSVPVLPCHYPVHTVGASVMMSDSSKQHINAKPLATSHPQ